MTEFNAFDHADAEGYTVSTSQKNVEERRKKSNAAQQMEINPGQKCLHLGVWDAGAFAWIQRL